MFSSDVRIWLAAGGVGLFLAGGLSLVAVRLLWRALVASLAAEVARHVQPAPEPQWLMRTEGEKRDKAHWGAVQVSERATSIALQVVEDAQVIFDRQQNLLLLMEWVRNGGNPEAPWTEIVKWKNQQEKQA